ncbi:MAG: hypothetical protein IKI11_06110 [Neisseriaceae bacterium]|nr:hypothetical protein [Neisseriaceae bacterium]
MKKTFVLITVLLTQFACSKEHKENTTKNVFNLAVKIAGAEKTMKLVDPNKPLPERPPVPDFPTDAEIQNKIAENLQYIQNKIIQKDGKTIYYFIKAKDKNNKTIYSVVDDKNKAQYYRVVLGKTAENYCAVQDFYINGKKRTEQQIILDKNCTLSLSDNRKNKDFLTLIIYEPYEKIYVIDNLDRQNNIRNVYGYENGERDFIVNDNFNSNQRLVFNFYRDKENPDIKIYTFNEQQLTEMTEINYKPIDEGADKHYMKHAERYTNIDLINRTCDKEFWGVEKENSTRAALESHIEDMKESGINRFTGNYKSFMNAKELINRK